MQTKTKHAALCLALPLAVGALSSFLTKHDMEPFAQAVRPAFYPPDWVFPAVWTVLFILMGIASYRVLRAYRIRTIAVYRLRIALAYYLLGLAVNFAWPFVFFRWQAYTVALAVLGALFYIVLRTYHSFSAIDKSAGILLLPYLAWLLYAGYLNLAVALLN